MTRAQKRKFIRELSRNVMAGLIADVPCMPEDWDGMELRRLMAMRFQDAVMRTPCDRARIREFNNECRTRNL